MSAFAPHDDEDTQDLSYVSPDPATTTPRPQEMTPEASHARSRSANPLLGNDNPLVSELEQEVLDEYSRLLRNVNLVSFPGHRVNWTGVARGGKNPPHPALLRTIHFPRSIANQPLLPTTSSPIKSPTSPAPPASMTLDGLRLLERKTATVCTLLKASVYSIVLQQQIWNEDQEQQQQQQQGGEGHYDDQTYHGGGYEGEGDMTFQ
ncbi:DASH complex subunit Dad3 [Penicillium verhagenii]|nr:DASH complex subunit Dad3 [Penicillium verhagenii]